MKKEFETPEISVMNFNVEDVITTSTSGEGKDGEGEFPIG